MHLSKLSDTEYNGLCTPAWMALTSALSHPCLVHSRTKHPTGPGTSRGDQFEPTFSSRAQTLPFYSPGRSLCKLPLSCYMGKWHSQRHLEGGNARVSWLEHREHWQRQRVGRAADFPVHLVPTGKTCAPTQEFPSVFLHSASNALHGSIATSQQSSSVLPSPVTGSGVHWPEHSESTVLVKI